MAVSWLWSGAQSHEGVTVVSKLTAPAASCRLIVSTNSGMTSPVFGPTATPDSGNYVRMTIDGLAASTLHYYQVEIDGVADTAETGQFRTFPTPGSAANFTFGFASCNESASNHAVFDKIAPKNPLFFCHLGDKHYQNIASNTESLFLTAHDNNLAQVRQNDFHRLVAVDYVWDDHDYGQDDSDRGSAARWAAASAYRRQVPHYDLVDPLGAIYHTFDVGLVRFIVTDNRYYRHAGLATDSRVKSVLGMTQKKWFKDLITQSATDGTRMIVWANSSQWSIEDASVGTDPEDSWAVFSYEKVELARHMRDVGCPPVVIISGDAHQSAARLRYNVGGFDFFVCQSAALDQTGNTRGGFWDYGPVSGGGHYSTLTITDNGAETLTAALTAYSVTTGGVESTLFSPTVDLMQRVVLPQNRGDHHSQRRMIKQA